MDAKEIDLKREALYIIGRLRKQIKIEKAAKNRAYSFIILKGLIEEYNAFVEACPAEDPQTDSNEAIIRIGNRNRG